MVCAGFSRKGLPHSQRGAAVPLGTKGVYHITVEYAFGFGLVGYMDTCVRVSHEAWKQTICASELLVCNGEMCGNMCKIV